MKKAIYVFLIGALVVVIGVSVFLLLKKDEGQGEVVELVIEEGVEEPEEEPEVKSYWRNENFTKTDKNNEFLEGDIWIGEGESAKFFYQQEIEAKENDEVVGDMAGAKEVAYYSVGLENFESHKFGEAWSAEGSHRARWVADDEIVFGNLASEHLLISWVGPTGNLKSNLEIQDWNKEWQDWDVDQKGQQIVYISAAGKLNLWRRGQESPQELTLSQENLKLSRPRFSPDRQKVTVFADESLVWLINLTDQGGVESDKELGDNTIYSYLEDTTEETVSLWSPDSKKLVVQDSGNLFDVDEGLSQAGLLQGFGLQGGTKSVGYEYYWSPNSQEIAMLDTGRRVYVTDIETGKAEMIIPETVAVYDWLDQSTLVYAKDGGVYKVDIESGEKEKLVGQDGNFSYLKGSPEGAYLAYVLDGDVWVLKMENK